MGKRTAFDDLKVGDEVIIVYDTNLEIVRVTRVTPTQIKRAIKKDKDTVTDAQIASARERMLGTTTEHNAIYNLSK